MQYSYLHGRLPFQKAFEFGFQRVVDRRFDLYFRLNFRGRDHAGFKFFISFLGIFFEMSIYDHRHWDNDKNQWVIHQEDE